jgi:hypothetical protein
MDRPADHHHAPTHDEHVEGADGHGDDGEPLGPLDVRAWAMAGLGVVMGLVVAGALLVAGGG